MPKNSQKSKQTIKIVDSQGIVIGDGNIIHNTYSVDGSSFRPFSNDFWLKIQEHTVNFVGRKFLDDELDNFLNNNECGYFTLIGEPGIGKTAWAAHITQKHHAVCHFCAPGDDTVTTLSNLIRQITLRSDGSVEIPPNSASGYSQYFSKAVSEASTRLNDKLVIVIDSLDQLIPSAIKTGGNVLLLPDSLPKGVFVITTTRPPAPLLITLPGFAKIQYAISGGDQANQIDAVQFIRETLASEPYAQYIQSQNISFDEFANALLEQSAGNFMYLHAQFIALKDPTRFAAGIEGLPIGLQDYYEKFWSALEQKINDEIVWEGTKSIFGLLAVAYDFVGTDWIEAVSNQTIKQIPGIVEKLIAEVLSRESKEGKYFWKIYHQSFRDFLAEKLGDLTPYHRQIVGYYRDVDFSTASIKEVAYGIRNFVKHLEVLGENDEIYRLVTANEKEPVWVNAHYALSGEYSGYLRDLNKAWTISENEEAWDFGRQLHCSVIQASVQSLSANIPLPLMIQAIKHKFWAPEVAVEYIRALPANAQRVSVLFELEPYLEIEKMPLWKLAWEWTLFTSDENERGLALRYLYPFVNDEGKSLIFELINKFEDPYVKIEHTVALYTSALEGDKTQIDEWLWQSLVEIKEKADKKTLKAFLEVGSVHPLRKEILSSWRDRIDLLTDDSEKTDWLSQSVSLCEAEERVTLIPQLLQDIEEGYDAALKEKVLQSISPFFSEQEVLRALEINQSIRDVERRNKNMTVLAKQVPATTMKYILDETLRILPLRTRLDLLVEIVEFLPNELLGHIWEHLSVTSIKPKDLLETLPAFVSKIPQDQRILGFELAKQIKPERERAELLARITLLLQPEFLAQGLVELKYIKSDEHYFRAIGRLICFTPVEREKQIIDSIQKKYERQSLKYFIKTGDQHLQNTNTIWFLIEYFGRSDDVELTLLWRSPRRAHWQIRMENYKEKEYSRFTLTRYITNEQDTLFKVLNTLNDSDCSILLQAILWSLQHFGWHYFELNRVLSNYKKYKAQKHIKPAFGSSSGLFNKFINTDYIFLKKLVGIDYDTSTFIPKLANAQTWLDVAKVFVSTWSENPELPPPPVLYIAMLAISAKPSDRWLDFVNIANIWKKIKYDGVRQDKKIWSQIIRTLSSRGLNEFLEDLNHLAPLIVEAGGQKAIQETYEALRDVKTWWATSNI